MEMWVQRWVGDYSLHQRREDIATFAAELPDDDITSTGDPYLAIVKDETVIEAVLNTPHGDWGPKGTQPPEPEEG